MRKNLEIAIEAAIEAGKAILQIYDLPEIEVTHKGDDSPLTKADSASNQVINSYLEKTEFPIISEENKQLEFGIRKNWNTCWIVDPLDGTKEFIKKNGEFTVNIALCEKGSPIFGVIYVPVSRELYYADVRSAESYKAILSTDHELNGELFKKEDRIYPGTKNEQILRVVGSRSHMNDDTLEFIDSVKNQYKDLEIVSKGSSLKFCLVAEGKADVYPRFAPTMEWDTAAGHAICRAVGLKVTSQESKEELEYNKENLLNPYFLISG